MRTGGIRCIGSRSLYYYSLGTARLNYETWIHYLHFSFFFCDFLSGALYLCLLTICILKGVFDLDFCFLDILLRFLMLFLIGNCKFKWCDGLQIVRCISKYVIKFWVSVWYRFGFEFLSFGSIGWGLSFKFWFWFWFDWVVS